jgi:integrase/recombinase XerC
VAGHGVGLAAFFAQADPQPPAFGIDVLDPNLVPLKAASRALPAIVADADDETRERFLEFFASTIRNPHTRRAYRAAVQDFLDWCDTAGVSTLREVRPLHVAAWIEQQSQTHKAPTAKQRLAAIRHLFDWLVNSQIVPINPAATVRGPTHVVRKGQTPMLEPAEARKLLDSIDTAMPIGLRDRALIALMAYSFARVGAALAMRHRRRSQETAVPHHRPPHQAADADAPRPIGSLSYDRTPHRGRWY